MKKIGLIFVVFLLLLAGFYSVVQSAVGRDFVRNRIIASLQDAGLEVQIDRIEGTLPHQVNLKGITIHSPDFDATIKELQARPVLWRLFKNELAVKDVHAKSIAISNQTPFDFDGKFRINRTRAILSGRSFGWDFQAQLNRRTFEIKTFVRKAFAFGTVEANGLIHPVQEGYQANFKWQVPGKAEGSGTATLVNRIIKGDFSIEPHSKGTFEIVGSVGKADIQVENLQALHIPDLYGKLNAKIDWSPEGTLIDATASQLYYGPFFAQTAHLKTNLQTADLQVENGKWKEVEVKNLNLHLDEENSFDLVATGKWKEPFSIQADGNKEQIEHLTGTVFNHPVTLLKPIPLSLRETHLELAVSDGRISAQLKENQGSIKLEKVPLDFLEVNPLEVPMTGTINLEGSFEGKKGKFEATVEHMQPFDSFGTFSGTLANDELHIKGNLKVKNEPILVLDLKLPIQEMKLDLHKPISGSATINTRMEHFLDFFDLGSHRFEGRLEGNLSLTQTLYNPKASGTLTLTNGMYENYYTGTRFENIQAEVTAENNRLILRSFTGQDTRGRGNISATGNLKLLPGQLYPFTVDATINDLQFTEIDLVTAAASGKIHMEGNTNSTVVKGDLQIVESELTIPDHIPSPPPDLQVTYRNAIHPIAPSEPTTPPYPLFLDLNVTTPEPILISGRGLDSEWRGTFHLGGTYTALAAQGKLELIQGDFSFSNRTFRLTDGSLSLSGVEHEMPYINLAATTETKGISIIARLQGPLDNPQITLQSSPPLPLSSIMSYLLFGQDLSEISGFQALEIATSLASLAGTGPDVMESTRKALGIDRIRIITDPSEDGDMVALQVGKYVTEGVLVSFTQGPSDSSPSISVEVELKNNFVFQIESDQHQEQGRFTLKWNLNY